MPELLEQPRTFQEAQLPPEAPRLPFVADDLDGEARGRVRRDLRVQIGALERELAELFAAAFPRRGITFAVPAAGGPRVLDVAELERVRDALADRVQDVRGWIADRGYVEERNREFLERLIAEPERFRWVRISNEDIGEPGCRHWHSRPRWGLLGMAMGWWRVKLSSGCPLATGRGPAAPTRPGLGEEAQAPPAAATGGWDRGLARRRVPGCDERAHRSALGRAPAPRRLAATPR